MRILIARMNHETNTFSPVATPLAAFGRHGPDWGEYAYRANKGMRTAMAAFIDAAERDGAELVTPVSAAANPSGPVAAAAYDAICDAIVAAAPGCDAVMLDLHGAMVAEQTPDGEGDLLARVRAALPGAPIAVALDLHANVTQKMIDHADVIVSFKTYPHVDMYETGAQAARLLLDRIHGRARPVLAWRQPPLLTSTLRSATAQGAMRRAVDAAREAEAGGMLAVSVLSGFSLADIPAPCISVVVVGDADAAAADAAAER
ncbi:M81 family metallopeptidase, partial [Burkholderia sp. Ac-20353]|uniref:M81 family metallopeptidase n=1 Tax=Burkholderia sp. Ac-20353 TaxID=2703894 RepID=UPI00197B8263